MEIQVEVHKHGLADRQSVRKSYRWINKRTDRQTDRQTEPGRLKIHSKRQTMSRNQTDRLHKGIQKEKQVAQNVVYIDDIF